MKRISLDAKGGNDRVEISKSLVIDTSLRGGSGQDAIIGGGGKDSIFGDAGNDTLSDSVGGAVIRGGDDSDFLRGGTGVDALFGENGDDNLEGGAAADYLDGGSGSDTIDYSARTSSVFATLRTELDAPITGSILTITGSGGAAEEGDTYASTETLWGGSASDQLALVNLNNDADELDGQFAVLIDGRGGNDTLDAGGAIGLNRYAAPSATLHGGQGNDTFTYDSGNYVSLYGDDGNDTFENGSDDSSYKLIDGGAGYDEWNNNDLSKDLFRLGNGIEALNAQLNNNALVEGNELNNVIILTSNGAGVTVFGNAGDDRITFLSGEAATAPVVLNGNDGNDTLTGSAASAETLRGGAGNDSLRGNGGADVYQAKDSQRDTLVVGPGAATISRDGIDSVLQLSSFI